MIVEGFAKYCALRGASFEDYSKGVDLLMEPCGYWLGRGYSAVLDAVQPQVAARREQYTVKV